MRYRRLVFALTLVGFLAWFLLGLWCGMTYAGITVTDEIIYTLEYCRDSHQYYADHPSQIYPGSSVEQEQQWADNYEAIIDWLQWKRGDLLFRGLKAGTGLKFCASWAFSC